MRGLATCLLLLSSAGENTVEIVVEKQKAVRFNLVVEELAAGVGDHCVSNGVGPFEEAVLRHGRDSPVGLK